MSDKRLRAPDLSKGAGSIVLVENAVVVPPGRGVPGDEAKTGGVLRPDGRLVGRSLMWRKGSPILKQPDMPPPESIKALSGTWVYMGVLFNHFGHALTESASRAWALDEIREKVDGVIFIPRFNLNPRRVAEKHDLLFRTLGIDLPVLNLDAPTRVERLHVPPQGFGLFDMIEGSPEFRNYARTRVGRGIAPKGPSRIYVSRTGLTLHEGSVFGERQLEQYLAAEGYEAYHPQFHSLADQVAAYRAASHVISTDGSPLHLLAMVGHAKQKVAIITRRPGDRDQEFARQIRAFQGSDVHCFNHLGRTWVDDGTSRPDGKSWGELDFTGLWRDLRAKGFIEGSNPWRSPSAEDIAKEVDLVSAERGQRLSVYGPSVPVPVAAPSDASHRLKRALKRILSKCQNLVRPGAVAGLVKVSPVGRIRPKNR